MESEITVIKDLIIASTSRENISLRMNYDNIAELIRDRWIVELLVDGEPKYKTASYNDFPYSTDMQEEIVNQLISELNIPENDATTIVNELIVTSKSRRNEIHNLNPQIVREKQDIASQILVSATFEGSQYSLRTKPTKDGWETYLLMNGIELTSVNHKSPIYQEESKRDTSFAKRIMVEFGKTSKDKYLKPIYEMITAASGRKNDIDVKALELKEAEALKEAEKKAAKEAEKAAKEADRAKEAAEKKATKEAEKAKRAQDRIEEHEKKLQAKVEAWKEARDEKEKGNIRIPFDIVADTVKREVNFFSMGDTQEFYIYRDGVYHNKDTETVMKRIVRDTYKRLYSDYCLKLSGERPDYIEEPNKAYTSEVLEKLRIDRMTSRDRVDAIQLKNKNLINLKNCVYDITTGEVKEHDPKYVFIRQIPVNYDSKATCPQITKFLKEVATEEDRKVLIEFSGYCLTPDTRIQKAFMLYGEGSNGKSIFLYLLQALIGSSNISNESLQHLEEDKFSVANLYGKFVNVHADLKNSIMAHDAVFKAITGGDILRGERKFQHSFEFRNTTKLIFSANTRNIPVISKDDFAFFRRWILIEFANQFLEAGEKEGAKPEDKNLREKITTEEELSGFLNLALEALKTVMQNQKFSYNKSISEVTKIYKLNSSSVSAFVDACIVASEEDTENINLYKNYEAWAGAKGVKVEALNTFSKILKKMGHTNYRHSEYMSGKKTNYWENIKVDEGQLLFEMTGKQPTEKQLSEIKAKKEPAPEMFGVDYLSA